MQRAAVMAARGPGKSPGFFYACPTPPAVRSRCIAVYLHHFVQQRGELYPTLTNCAPSFRMRHQTTQER